MSDIDPISIAEQDASGTAQENMSAPEINPLQEELLLIRAEKEILQKELSELKDQYLRFRADTDNYRKRIQKEREEDKKFSNSQLLTDLVTILDDFDRAIKSTENTKDAANIYSGIIIIEQQLISLLEKKYGLKRFESIGTEFNPEHHEALMMIPSETPDEEMLVVEEFQKGYNLHDKVLRAAKVKVGPKSLKTEQ